jgi:alkylated DNA nucleotide flippase Atl1
MGYKEMDLVWAKSQATRLDKFVLLAIAKTYNPGKGSYPSQKHIAKMTGIADPRGVRRSLQRLTELGELVWVRGSNNSGKSNVYYITFIEQPVAKLTAIANTKMTPVNDQNDLLTSSQIDPLLNKRLDNLLNAEEVVFDSRFASPLMKKSVDRVAGVLSPLQVSDLLETFANSYDCSSAYTDEIRVTRWYAQLDKAASQAEREVR